MINTLVIDDDRDIGKLMALALDDPEFIDAQIADSVINGLLSIIANTPKILILDIFFSGSSTGIDILKSVRANDAFKDMFIIVISGADFINTEKCLTMGANAFLAKPFSPAALRELVLTQK